MTIREIVQVLREPIPYQWRVQSKTKTGKLMCSAYVDARDVMNRLDDVCVWEVRYAHVADTIMATLEIHADDGRFCRSDFGQRIETNTQDQMYEQAIKSSSSDAFKRAAVAFGLGRFLYDMDMVFVEGDQYGRPVDGYGNAIWDLTSHINGLKKMPQPKPSPDPQPVQSAEQKEATETAQQPDPNVLTQEKFDAMVKFLTEGKVKEVEAGMKKYKMNDAQKKVLTSMISQVKAEAIKKSAK
jgi:hypothetical protein